MRCTQSRSLVRRKLAKSIVRGALASLLQHHENTPTLQKMRTAFLILMYSTYEYVNGIIYALTL
jgi:hypothetical protein